MRCLGCLAVLLAAKGGSFPVLTVRTPPYHPLSDASRVRQAPVADGWIRVTRGSDKAIPASSRNASQGSVVICRGFTVRGRGQLNCQARLGRNPGGANPGVVVVPQVGAKPDVTTIMSPLL